MCSATALENLLRDGEYYWRLKSSNGAVLWPKNIAGLISYSNNFVTAVTIKHSNEVQSIGVDIEKIMSTQKAIDLSQTILKCPTPSDMIMDITHYITLL